MYDTSSASIASIIITGVAVVLTLFIIFTLIYNKAKYTLGSSFYYQLMFLIGCLVTEVASLLFVLSPSADYICILRIWMLNLPITFMYAILIAKAFVFYKSVTHKGLTAIKNEKMLVLIIMSTSILVIVIYCFIWTFVDPPK